MAARPTAPLAQLLVWLALCGCSKPVAAHWAGGAPRFEGALARLSGTREGNWTFWFPNGGLREQGCYAGGLRVGIWKQWYANGELRSEGEREAAADENASPRTGYWRLWFENGAPEAQGVFVHGLREGHWDYHLTDGELDGDRTGEYHLDQILR